MIRFRCPKCRKKYRVADHHAGSKFDCLKCKQRVQVPASPTVPKGEGRTSRPLKVMAIIIFAGCVIVGAAVGVLLVWLATARP